ncbi:MAG: GspH/FimT family pseudopilin [Candidatus Methylumidiphilus sp.]
MKKISALGFTLIELMVTISMMGIVLTFGVPSLTAMLKNSRIITQANNFISTLNYARSEAVKRGVRVTVCKINGGDFTKCDTGGSWNQGWIVFVDGGNGFVGNPTTVTPASGTILRVHEGFATLTVSTSGVANYVSFAPNGTSQTSSGAFQAGTLTVCPPSPAGSIKGRSIVINAVGRAVIRQDTCT